MKRFLLFLLVTITGYQSYAQQFSTFYCEYSLYDLHDIKNNESLWSIAKQTLIEVNKVTPKNAEIVNMMHLIAEENGYKQLKDVYDSDHHKWNEELRSCIAIPCIPVMQYKKYIWKNNDKLWKVSEKVLKDIGVVWPSNTDIYIESQYISRANSFNEIKEFEAFIAKNPGKEILLPYPIYQGEKKISNNSKPVNTSQPSAPASKPVSASTPSQKPAVTPQKQTTTPKPAVATPKSAATTPQPAVSTSQPTVTSKAMTLKQMVTQPLGVLPAENVAIDAKTAQRQLAAVDSRWKVSTNTGGQVHINNYDMTYAGKTMDAYCNVYYKNVSTGWLQTNYIFYFKKEKEAIAFYQSLLSQMKSEGATVNSEKSPDSHTHRSELTCYGLPVSVSQVKASTNYKYQVRIKIDYEPFTI